MKQQGITPVHPAVGDAFSLGQASFTVLGPSSIVSDSNNNNSLAIRITYGNTSFLLTGDAEHEEEEEDVYKRQAICNVSPLELARKNLVPVLIGFFCTFLAACFLL